MRATRKSLICLTIVFSATSCGYQFTKSTTTTTSTTSTTTSIDYGQDCNLTVDTKLKELFVAATTAHDNASDSNSGPTSAEYYESMRALKELRTYVRRLDLPTMSVVQSELVDAIENFLNAYNTYWESGKKNLSVNDYLIPLSDARLDFLDAWMSDCTK